MVDENSSCYSKDMLLLSVKVTLCWNTGSVCKKLLFHGSPEMKKTPFQYQNYAILRIEKRLVSNTNTGFSHTCNHSMNEHSVRYNSNENIDLYHQVQAKEHPSGTMSIIYDFTIKL